MYKYSKNFDVHLPTPDPTIALALLSPNLLPQPKSTTLVVETKREDDNGLKNRRRRNAIDALCMMSFNSFYDSKRWCGKKRPVLLRANEG